MNKINLDKFLIWASVILNSLYYLLLLMLFLNLNYKLVSNPGSYLVLLFSFGAFLALLIPPALFLVLISQIVSIVVKKIKRVPITKIAWVMLIINFITVIAYILVLAFSSYRFSERVLIEKDGKKVSDLKNVENALELYYEKYQYYPHVEGLTAAERWQKLMSRVVNSDIGVNSLPQDTDFPRQSYDYKDGNAGKDFVLKTTLIGSTDKLSGDVDGIIFGVDCGLNSSEDKEYCISR